MYSFLRWSFVKSYWRLCFKMVMLQLAPLPSPAGASTALWAWKVSAERLTFGGWTVSFISVTVWLITALSLFFSVMYGWICLRQWWGQLTTFFFFQVSWTGRHSVKISETCTGFHSLSRCLHCETTYKGCGEGYRGRGQRGVMQGFFGSDDFQGYCGSDCFYEAGGSICFMQCVPHVWTCHIYCLFYFIGFSLFYYCIK